MYSRGILERDLSEFIEEIYGMKLSAEGI